jgi:hypothetical protein
VIDCVTGNKWPATGPACALPPRQLSRHVNAVDLDRAGTIDTLDEPAPAAGPECDHMGAAPPPQPRPWPPSCGDAAAAIARRNRTNNYPHTDVGASECRIDRYLTRHGSTRRTLSRTYAGAVESGSRSLPRCQPIWACSPTRSPPAAAAQSARDTERVRTPGLPVEVDERVESAFSFAALCRRPRGSAAIRPAVAGSASSSRRVRCGRRVRGLPGDSP